MLTKVRAQSSLFGLPELVFNVANEPESDLVQLRNLDGLGPAKAAISTSPLGSRSGGHYVGSSVEPRNLVFTLHPNPDWDQWTFEKLRELTDQYFMSGMPVHLVFETDEKPPVGISGYVESNEPVLFSKDPETQVSIICPDPDFVAESQTAITGLSSDAAVNINYDGSVDTGFNLLIEQSVAGTVGNFDILLRDTKFYVYMYYGAGAPVNMLSPTTDLEINTMPGDKRARLIGSTNMNLLPYVRRESVWQVLKKGVNSFNLNTNYGVQNWTMKYFARYGSL